MAKQTLNIKTRYGSFECLLEPEKDMGGYVVEARNVPGGISWGRTKKEAKKMIIEAIEGAIEAKIIVDAEKRGFVRARTNWHSVPTV